MKSYSSICKLLVVFFLFLTMVSCESKVSETFEFSNSEGDLKVKIWGEQSNSFDPWVMTVETIEDDKVISSGTLETYLSEPSKETILISWVDSYNGVITFKEKDGEVKIYPIGK